MSADDLVVGEVGVADAGSEGGNTVGGAGDFGEVEVVDSLPDTNSGKPYSVPDTGSTVALLAFSVALLVLSQRKISRAE